jgi:hypothetical protein
MNNHGDPYPGGIIQLVGPSFASIWDWESRWDQGSRDAPLYSVAKHDPLTYTSRRTSQNESSYEVLHETAELTCKPNSVLYDIKVSFPRGIQTVQYTTSDVKPLSPIWVSTDTQVDLDMPEGTKAQSLDPDHFTLSLVLPADTQALEDWNRRMRILFPLTNQWTLLDALELVLQDKIFSKYTRVVPTYDDSWCNKSSTSINGTTLFDCEIQDITSSSAEMNLSCKSIV